MADEIKDEVTTESAEIATQEVDYDKELEDAAKATRNQIGYERRQKKDEVGDDSQPITKKDLAEVVNTFKQTVESGNLDTLLEKKANGNESLKKLMKTLYDTRTNPAADMSLRVDDAYAIANRKSIEKTVKEITVARENRSQVSNVGQGSNQETYQKPGSNIVSDSQRKELEKLGTNYGFSGKQLESFVEGSVKRMSQ